MYKHNTFIIQ